MTLRAFTISLLLCTLLCSGGSYAAVELNEDVPETYIVQRGDTLWGIAGMYLKRPWRWPELWDVNPQIDNPHLIYPGDELHLTWVGGKPRLRMRRGRDIKLTPNMRVTPLDLAIPTIPLDQIGPWLRRNRVLEAKELNYSAYVVAGDEQALISGPGDRIFGRGPFPDDERRYGIYRVGQHYADPITAEYLGYQVIDIGAAKLLSSNRDEVAGLEVTRVTEEVRIGDRLLPYEERILDSSFHPRAPAEDIDGVMIGVDGGLDQIGQYSIVTINRGKRDGLQIGNVLAVYQLGRIVFDKATQTNVQLPDTRAGLAMVFDAYEKVSFAIILRTTRPLHVMDIVKNP
ncbi:MAG: LysM peptidoglycan-binding domain-containing protein [Halioglobus sp.]|nr:LysM peptidoglycan-binding domain-containing protein [Halioglobus sp.]